MNRPKETHRKYDAAGTLKPRTGRSGIGVVERYAVLRVAGHNKQDWDPSRTTIMIENKALPQLAFIFRTMINMGIVGRFLNAKPWVNGDVSVHASPHPMCHAPGPCYSLLLAEDSPAPAAHGEPLHPVLAAAGARRSACPRRRLRSSADIVSMPPVGALGGEVPVDPRRRRAWRAPGLLRYVERPLSYRPPPAWANPFASRPFSQPTSPWMRRACSTMSPTNTFATPRTPITIGSVADWDTVAFTSCRWRRVS